MAGCVACKPHGAKLECTAHAPNVLQSKHTTPPILSDVQALSGRTYFMETASYLTAYPGASKADPRLLPGATLADPPSPQRPGARRQPHKTPAVPLSPSLLTDQQHNHYHNSVSNVNGHTGHTASYAYRDMRGAHGSPRAAALHALPHATFMPSQPLRSYVTPRSHHTIKSEDTSRHMN